MPLRHQDPTTGRWNGIDPVTHFSSSTYAGYNNNPVFWADPSGACGTSWLSKAFCTVKTGIGVALGNPNVRKGVKGAMRANQVRKMFNDGGKKTPIHIYVELGNIRQVEVILDTGEKYTTERQNTFKGRGGVNGGHVFIQIGEDYYDFSPTLDEGKEDTKINNRLKYLHSKGKFSTYKDGDLRSLETHKDRAFYKFTLYATSEQVKEINKTIRYLQTGKINFSYSLFGKRCTSASVFLLRKSGVLSFNNSFQRKKATLIPRLLVKYLMRQGVEVELLKPHAVYKYKDLRNVFYKSDNPFLD